MSTSRKVLFNTGVQFVNRFVLAGSAFLVSLLIARSFGARGFGEYSKATTYVAIFYLFADFGLNALVLRLITNKPELEKKYVANLLGLRLVSGVILTLIALGIAFLLPYDSVRNEGFTPVAKWSIAALSILVLYQSFVNTTGVIFQKHLRYDLSTIGNVVGSLVTFAAAFIFIISGFSIPLVLLAYTLGSVCTSIILLKFVKKLFPQFSPEYSWVFSKQLIKQALPLGLTLVLNLVYFRADIFILTLFRTTTEVGTYGLAYKFFEFPITIPTFFANSLYPILLARAKEKHKFRQTVYKSGLFLLLLSVATMVVFYVGAPLLAYIREDFTPSISVLRLLSLSMPVFFLSSLGMWVMITYGKNKELLLIYFWGMVVNIVLNLFFIPLYGTTGAAAVTFVSELVILIASAYITIKTINQE